MLCKSVPNQSTTGGRVTAEWLADIPLFSQLRPELKQELSRHCRSVRFRVDEFVVRQSDPATYVYFVVKGRLRSLFYSSNGKEVAFEEFKAGDYFGQFSAIDSQSQFTSVVALEDVSLLCLPCTVFRQLLSNHAGIASSVTCRTSLLVRQLSQRICEYSTLGVGARVRAEVLRLAYKHKRVKASVGACRSNTARCSQIGELRGISTDDHAEPVIIDAFPTHADFANRISTHREAVTREINRLERAGVIERKHGEFIVTDIAALQSLVAARSHEKLH